MKASAMEICSLSCCVCQGPGTSVTMETNIQPLGGTSLRAAFKRISQFSTMLLLPPFKIKGGGKLIDYKSNGKRNAVFVKTKMLRDL